MYCLNVGVLNTMFAGINNLQSTGKDAFKQLRKTDEHLIEKIVQCQWINYCLFFKLQGQLWCSASPGKPPPTHMSSHTKAQEHTHTHTQMESHTLVNGSRPTDTHAPLTIASRTEMRLMRACACAPHACSVQVHGEVMQCGMKHTRTRWAQCVVLRTEEAPLQWILVTWARGKLFAAEEEEGQGWTFLFEKYTGITAYSVSNVFTKYSSSAGYSE